MMREDAPQTARTSQDLFGLVAQGQDRISARVIQDLERLLNIRGVQAYCLECPASGAATRSQPEAKRSTLEMLAALFSR